MRSAVLFQFTSFLQQEEGKASHSERHQWGPCSQPCVWLCPAARHQAWPSTAASSPPQPAAAMSPRPLQWPWAGEALIRLSLFLPPTAPLLVESHRAMGRDRRKEPGHTVPGSGGRGSGTRARIELGRGDRAQCTQTCWVFVLDAPGIIANGRWIFPLPTAVLSGKRTTSKQRCQPQRQGDYC